MRQLSQCKKTDLLEACCQNFMMTQFQMKLSVSMTLLIYGFQIKTYLRVLSSTSLCYLNVTLIGFTTQKKHIC